MLVCTSGLCLGPAGPELHLHGAPPNPASHLALPLRPLRDGEAAGSLFLGVPLCSRSAVPLGFSAGRLGFLSPWSGIAPAGRQGLNAFALRPVRLVSHRGVAVAARLRNYPPCGWKINKHIATRAPFEVRCSVSDAEFVLPNFLNIYQLFLPSPWSALTFLLSHRMITFTIFEFF